MKPSSTDQPRGTESLHDAQFDRPTIQASAVEYVFRVASTTRQLRERIL